MHRTRHPVQFPVNSDAEDSPTNTSVRLLFKGTSILQNAIDVISIGDLL